MSDPNAKVKKRQIILIAGSATVILLCVVGGMVMFESAPPVRTEKPKTVSIAAPGGVEDKDAWRAQQAAEDHNNGKKIEDLTAQLAKTREDQQKLLDAVEKLGKGAPSPEYSAQSSASNLREPLPASGQILHAPGSTGMTANAPANAMPLNSPLNQAIAQPPAREIEIITNKRTSKPTETAGNKEILGFPVSEAAKKYGGGGGGQSGRGVEFLPAGTFVRVALLNGADAPTGGQAQSNPLAVALDALDVANMANKYKLDIKGCRFIAAVWGDLSSERTMGRTDSMTCIINGETLEIPVKGNIIGEDGKYGMRGRLVTKQGQVLANAAFAGISSGIGKAFQQSANTVSNTALGATSIIEPGAVGRAALGSGVSNMGSALEQYYLKAADKLFPIIETDGGRIVEILITKGAVYTGKSGSATTNYANMLKRAGSSTGSDDYED